MSQKEIFHDLVAALCHEQWSGRMIYMLGKSQKKSDGSIVIPPDLAERWKRQMTTAYESLSEDEKKIDHIEADKFIVLFVDNAAITEIAALTDMREAIGEDEKTMLAELPEIARRIKRDADRYKKLFIVTPTEFAALHGRALRENRPFSELIDEWHDIPLYTAKEKMKMAINFSMVDEDSISIQAVQLKRCVNHSIVAVKINGIWVEVIKELYDQNFDHICSANGIAEVLKEKKLD